MHVVNKCPSFWTKVLLSTFPSQLMCNAMRLQECMYLAASSLSNVGGKALDFMYTPFTPVKGQAMWPRRFEDYGYGDDQILRSRVMMLEANQRGMKIMLAAIFIVCLFSLLATIIPML
ncbi:uncharacterized protein LOC131324018 [Rhododendron vialii]|uniref:uncharacterized protein LOC131324018 n=1 Tax=Rhododendron vialii TaxID=182163 RepID=UPI002660053A|nr:uncharacterized protein LOC131324018 [Rhododendron vialii]